MKKQIASLFVVLAMALPGWAASHSRSIGPQNQFHVAPKKGVSPAYDRIQKRLAADEAVRQERLAKMGIQPATSGKVAAAASKQKPRRNVPGVAGTVGFVAATQIPAGGFVSTNPVLTGDFNGDGKKDLVTVVTTPSFAISIAASLGNGDGTFQTASITAIPANSSDAFVVGDVNGDGKDDVVIVHLLGSISSSSSLDVFLSNGDGTFTFYNNFVITSNDLAGGILYDINGDGKLDVVAVDSAGQSSGVGNVWVLLGDGQGNFGTPAQVPLSSHAGSSLVFGDFNGDGLLDFADNDYQSGQLTVYLGTSSNPQFAAAASYTTPDARYDGCANAVGDMTGDGKPEIVSANCGDNTVTIYVNNGDGTFQQGAYFAAANAGTGITPFIIPTGVTIADVNGDGHGDVIVTNNESADVTVLLGNGDGTVTVPSVGYATGGDPANSVLVADFNGDGLADIVVADDYYSFSYMKGYGDGTFQAAVDYYSPTPDNGQGISWDVASGDFNNDGFADVVLGNTCCDNTLGITVFLSNGDGTLQAGVNYGSGGNLEYVAVADFNKDGALDIAAVANTTGAVQVFSGVANNGTGNGTFTAGTAIPTGDTQAERIVVADFNGDTWPDVAVASSEGSNFVVLLNDGTGNLVPQQPVATYSGPSDIIAVDVNGDGKIDLLMPEFSTGTLAVFLGNGDGTFQQELDYPLGNYPYHIAVGDVNGDGKLDVVATDEDYALGMGVVVAIGDGNGGFQLVSNTPYTSTIQNPFEFQPYPTYIQMTDLNGDGNLDLIYTNTEYSTVGVMFGNGDGTFQTPLEYPSGGYAYGLALADVNGDGAVDVVTASESASAATVLLNTSGSKLLPDYTVSANPTSATVTAGQAATVMFTLTPRNFYNGTVTFSCTGLPSKAACNFSNPSLTPDGNAQMTSTLTITTTAATTSGMLTPMQGNPWMDNPWTGNTSLLASFSLVGTFGLMLAGFSKKNRRLAVVLGVLAVGMMIFTVGCGGSSSTPPPVQTIPGTPAGTYTVTVTATGTAGTNGGNTSAHNVTVNLTVQ